MKTEQTAVDTFVPRKVARRDFLGNISDDTCKRWEDKGLLPAPIVLSPKVVGWRRSTLEKFLATRSEASA
jgi:predicted DNA-binding transcriptional regulator AlpA